MYILDFSLHWLTETYVHIFLKRKIAFVLQHLYSSINNRAQTLVRGCLSAVSEGLRSHGVQCEGLNHHLNTPRHPTSLPEGGQHHAWAQREDPGFCSH